MWLSHTHTRCHPKQAHTQTHVHLAEKKIKIKKVKFSGYPPGDSLGALPQKRFIQPCVLLCLMQMRCPAHLLCAFAGKFTPHRLIFPLTTGSSPCHFSFLGVGTVFLPFLRWSFDMLNLMRHAPLPMPRRLYVLAPQAHQASVCFCLSFPSDMSVSCCIFRCPFCQGIYFAIFQGNCRLLRISLAHKDERDRRAHCVTIRLVEGSNHCLLICHFVKHFFCISNECKAYQEL